MKKTNFDQLEQLLIDLIDYEENEVSVDYIVVQAINKLQEIVDDERDDCE